MSDIQQAEKPTNGAIIDDLFEKAKGGFDAVVICGFDDKGAMKMYCYPDQTIVAHWILSKAQFELNVFEKNNAQQQPPAEQDEDKPAKKKAKR